MNELEQSINYLFEKIPDSERKREIIQEITQNLSEKVSDLTKEGMTEKEAIHKALEDFGDIGELRKELVSSSRTEQCKKAGLSLAFSIWGTILISALFLFINFYYSPKVLWFVYPVFAVLWWPSALFFRWRSIRFNASFGLPFSLLSTLMIIGVVIFTNLYFSPKVIWFFYPIFAVIWWPLGVFFYWLRNKGQKEGESNE